MMADQTELMKHMSEMITKFVNQQELPSQVVPKPNNKTEAQQNKEKQVVFRDPNTSRQNAQAVHLRSGGNIENPREKSREHREVEFKEIPDEKEKENGDEEENDSSEEEKSSINEKIRIPFPEALKEKRKLPKGDTKEIENVLKNVIIEIPLFKALEKIPSYAKFMK